MSALGHQRTFATQKVMSALPPKADIYSYIELDPSPIALYGVAVGISIINYPRRSDLKSASLGRIIMHHVATAYLLAYHHCTHWWCGTHIDPCEAADVQR